jgi:hypothetical protein
VFLVAIAVPVRAQTTWRVIGRHGGDLVDGTSGGLRTGVCGVTSDGGAQLVG